MMKQRKGLMTHTEENLKLRHGDLATDKHQALAHRLKLTSEPS